MTRTSAEPSVTDAAGSIYLRPATREDERFLFDLYRSQRLHELSPFGWDEAQTDAFLQLQFRARERHYQVQDLAVDRKIVLLDRVAIGELIVMRSSTEIRLADIVLLPGHRGKGIGSSLIRDLFNEARVADLPVTLHVEKSNPALRLYTRLGFRIAADTGMHVRMEWNPAGQEPGER